MNYLDKILDFSGDHEGVTLEIYHLQHGDEDGGGNYTPPHYSVEVLLDGKRTVSYHGPVLNVVLKEVWEELEEMYG